ncbi:MAG: clostripain-related cysteine peptidase [bacterium]|nr:clostripain-related cysteine peptidase [bacterium]
MSTFRLLVLQCLFFIAFTVTSSAQSNSTFSGTLDAEKTFYEYPLLIEQDNTTITADAIATSGDLDTILYLLDSAGNVLSQNDNRVRDDLNAYIQYPSADAGAYTLILARYDLDDGETSGDFSLTITTAPTITELPAYDISPQALSDAGYPTQDPKPSADWTILVYYGGDNNLEGSLIHDLKEFELAGGESDNVRIVAFLDRSPDHSDESGNWATAKIYEVTENLDANKQTINSQELADLGEVDSGDGLTLAQFLTWGIRHYPAQNYVIAFGSHGAGWAGVITDDTDKSIITLPEIDQAFKTVQTEISQPFALVINDACLMSSVEYLSVLSQYALEAYASSEIVVDPALNMTDFTTNLKNTTPDMILIGEELINYYIDIDAMLRQGGEGVYMTNAITNLTTMPSLQEALDNFANLILTDPLRYSPIIGGARNNAYTYTAFSNSSTLIDLGSFMRLVITLSDDNRLVDSAQAVINALQNTVPYGNGGENVRNARILYQNIYFPKKAKDFDNDYFVNSPLTSWGEMLRTYYNTFTPKVWDDAILFHAPAAPNLNIMSYHPATTTSIIDPLWIEMEITGRNFGRAFMTVDRLLPDGTYERIANNQIESVDRDEIGNIIRVNTWVDGVDSGISDWNVTGYSLSDTNQERFVLVANSEDTLSIEGRYRTNPDSEWFDVNVIFPNFTETTVSSVISKNPDSGSSGVITIPAGSEFQVYMALVSDDGQIQLLPDESMTFIWQESNGLSLSVTPAPSGEYQVGFLVETLNGEQTWEAVPITVNNDGLDPHLRGFTSIDAGYTITLDESWANVFQDNTFRYKEFPSLDANQERLRIYYHALSYDSYFGANAITAQTMLDTYGYISTAQETITVNNQEIEIVTYNDGRFTVGVGAYYPAFNGGGLFISVESENANSEPNTLLNRLTPILESLRLFNSNDYFGNRTNVWQIGEFGDVTSETPGARYQIRKDWLQNQYWDKMWLVSVPDSAENPYTSTTFHKIAKVDAVDAVHLRDAILTDAVQPNSTNFTITETRVYYTQLMTWQVALYTLERDDIAIMGRVYAMVRGDNQNYVIWQEAPADIAPDLFTNTFELMVDAFVPAKPLRTYSLSDYGFKLYYPQNFEFFTGNILPDENSTIFTLNATKTLEYWIDFYPNVITLEEALSEWQAFSGYPIVEDPQNVVYNGKEGLRFRFQFESERGLYDGYAFITLSADETHAIAFNPMWVNEPANLPYFEWLMNNNYYGVDVDVESPTVDENAVEYRSNWRIEKYDEIGLEMGVLGMWNTPSIYRQASLREPYLIINSPEYIPAPTTFYLYVILLDEYVDEIPLLTDPQATDVMIDGVTGKQLIVQYDDESWCAYIFFTSENGVTYVIEFFGDTPEQVTAMIDEFVPTVSTFPADLEALKLLMNSTEGYIPTPITDWRVEKLDKIGLEFGVQSSWVIEPINEVFGLNEAYYRAYSPDSLPTTFLIYISDTMDYVSMAENWTEDYSDISIAGVNGKRFTIDWGDGTWSDMVTFTGDNGLTYRLEFWGYNQDLATTLLNDLIPLISTYPIAE